MREMLNLSVRLLIIALLAGLVLGATNLVTEGPIREYEAEKAESARKECLPNAENFEKLELSQPVPEEADTDRFSTIQAVYRGISGGRTTGYIFEMKVNGYKGGVVLTIGITGETDGSTITKIIPGKHDETPGLGTKALDPARLSGYDGQNLGEAQVDAVTGATITSEAVNTAIGIARTYYSKVLSAEGGSDGVESN